MSGLYVLLHVLAWMAAVHAFFRSSTPQGAIAWCLALIMFPIVALPVYLVFGSTHFRGYVEIARAGQMSQCGPDLSRVIDWFRGHVYAPGDEKQMLIKLFHLPPVRGGSVELLRDGEATYDRLIAEIAKAQDYVLVLYYKVADDSAGTVLKHSLVDAARRGVKVYFVFDEMGSPGLTDFRKQLAEAGVQAWSFRTARGWRHRLQWNFRNHRKLVVVDGQVALVGGLNMADKYLGKNPRIGPWRDTHLCLTGPAVLGVQMVFAEDYYWASGGKLPCLSWPLPAPSHNPEVAPVCGYLGFGPSDRQPRGLLFYLACISLARHRLWLASPYFVPDPAIIHALRLAALRGVEVRILLPPSRFETYMGWAALPFLRQLQGSGVEFWEFSHYNHSKVMLVDDWLSWVGSSNLDNRSLRLNFEGNLVVLDQAFAQEVTQMLEADFASSRQLNGQDLRRGGLGQWLLCPWIRLTSYIQFCKSREGVPLRKLRIREQ